MKRFSAFRFGRLARSLPWLILSLVLASVQAETQEHLGDVLRGELTSHSPVNQNDGTRYYRHLICEGDAGKVGLYRFNGPFKARLSVTSIESDLLGSSQRHTDNGLLLVQLPDDACLTVIVSGATDNAYGPYRLEPVNIQPLAMDDTLILNTEYLSQLDPSLAYRFELPIPESLELDLTLFDTSGSFTAFIGDGEQRDLADAVACEGSELQLHAYLAAGNYQLVLLPNERPNAMRARSDCADFTSNPGQAVHLHSQTIALPAGSRSGGELPEREVINGLLTQGSHDAYHFSLARPSSVQIDLRSSDFDAYLVLTGPDVDVRDDDSGSGSDASITTTLPAGDYQLVARDFGALYRAGRYQLWMETHPVKNALLEQPGEIHLGDRIEGQLNSTSHHYNLILEQPAEMTVDVTSDDFDPELTLSNSVINRTDADSGLGNGARISEHLAPGTYQLDVSAADRGNGRYTISVANSADTIRIQNDGIVTPGDRFYGEFERGQTLQYWLVADDPASVRIRASSHTLDTILRLSGRGLVLENDDHGGSTHSMIEVDLIPGTFTLEVSEWGSDHNSGIILIEILADD
ncbi:hypothetical protein BGP77_15655 [Saccharospirillum sp. MSK14-1]|nr:hypothetical protein [Saccharospirillum sp. MSK14-1]PTY37900.1 hypothetical protein BGP77_15655 [Saccharospirillum sp. MSK14-1]